MVQLDRLGLSPIVTDGSISVELSRRGLTERPPDRYNLTAPTIVEQIHRDFIEAGATLIQTNTASANRFALENATLSTRVAEINRKGVWLARTASAGAAIVAGTIGPTGLLMHPLGPLTHKNILSCFSEQALALLSAGCDVIILKSFISIDELELAVRAVRNVSTSIPVIALKSFPEDGAVLTSSFPLHVAQRLTDLDVQAIGSNGTVGPQRMMGIINALRSDGVSLVAMPDVGIPMLVDGATVYSSDEGYVASAAVRLVESGVSIVGAEGGASIHHVSAIANAVQTCVVGSKPPKARSTSSHDTPNNTPKPLTQFQENLEQGFVSTVELDVPRGIDMSSVVEGARYLKEHGVHAVNISDGARARLRMSAIAISRVVMEKTGMECITHMACRDHNMVGLQSELLGAHALGVHNILAVTGDPTHIGDFPVASSVYDVDSIGLIRAMRKMNEGQDLMGNPLGEQTSFSISCAVNPMADDLEREIDRLAEKVDQGAQIAFTQPMFDEVAVQQFLERIAHLKVKFVLGIIPLRNTRHAEFLHFEVPGMTIPEWARKRMSQATSQDMATETGVEMAVNLLNAVRNNIHGVYLMPPFKKYEVAVRILES